MLVLFQIERKKIDEMKLGENALITLPSCITSSMKCDKFTLMNENMEKLLELKKFNVRLSMVSNVVITMKFWRSTKSFYFRVIFLFIIFLFLFFDL